MSPSPSPQASSSTPLARHKACLCCRRKKMKCDGVRPVCSTCAKSIRDYECKYEEKSPYSRRQLLEIKVNRLETRLRELLSNRSKQTAISPMSSPSSSTPSLSARSISSRNNSDTSLMPRDHELQDYDMILGETSKDSTDFSWLDAMSTAPGFLADISLSPTVAMDLDPEVFLNPQKNAAESEIVPEDRDSLIDAFLCRCHQWNFNMDPVAFRASLSSEFSTTTPHPALVHVILLIASSYFPPSPHLGQLSSQFLTQTLEAISSGIEQAERLLDIVQASCLLASYFYSQDRTLEGYYHSTSAARLVTTIGLDKLPASVVSDALQEKVTTLCQVFAVDKGWAVSTGLPSLMPDDELWLALILASPQPAHSSPDNVNLQGRVPGDRQREILALRLGAYSLYEMSYRVMRLYSPSDEEFQREHASLDSSLTHFINTLPPIFNTRRSGRFTDSMDIQMALIHTLIYTSTIYLERNRITTDRDAFKKCLMAVDSITSIIQQLNGDDYRFLDPLISSCWFSAAHVCLYVLKSSGTTTGNMDFVGVYYNSLLFAIKELGKTFPSADAQARQMEAVQRSSGLPLRDGDVV